jgi:hypothetical protein
MHKTVSGNGSHGTKRYTRFHGPALERETGEAQRSVEQVRDRLAANNVTLLVETKGDNTFYGLRTRLSADVWFYNLGDAYNFGRYLGWKPVTQKF